LDCRPGNQENQNFASGQTDAHEELLQKRPERTTEPRNKDLEVLCATQIRKNESVWREKKFTKEWQQY
jgi:hypothetical protein